MNSQSAICSAKGCRHTATWSLRWRNPKIHDADRVKIWMACDEHRDHLTEFLTRRDFPTDVVPVDSIGLNDA